MRSARSITMTSRLRLPIAAMTSLAVVAGFSASVYAAPPAPPAGESSDLRIGVLALADAIAAVGQTPELAEPLPYTRTSLAHVLNLDDVVVAELVDALEQHGLAAAMEEVPGVVDATLVDGVLSFGYSQHVTVPALPLAQDDGTLRFTEESSAGSLDVTLATPPGGERFEVRVDQSQPDPLLRFALVTEPELELSVDIDTDDLDGFGAREGFSNVSVTGGYYRLHRTSAITLRDPDGRGLLTLEDLRYSTMPDLFRVVRGADDIDVALDLALPASVAVVGGATDAARGSLTLTEDDTPADKVWPAAADATRTYGSALDQVTGLTSVDGLVALSKYTGVSLALQDAGDVQFPQLGGGTADLFAPADRLLDLLATSAVAQIRCGVAPGNPPTGTPAPGDTVYCDAVTPANLGPVTSATWNLAGTGTVVTPAAGQTAAVGADPDGNVRLDGTDGEPDLTVTLVAGGTTYTARTLPHTVQQVVSRIRSIGDGGASTAAASIDVTAQRLDVAVDIQDDSTTESLPLGNPGTLGTLVGLTGLEDDENARVPATATDSRYDVGFGVSTGTPAPDEERATVLLPRDGSLLTVQRGLRLHARRPQQPGRAHRLPRRARRRHGRHPGTRGQRTRRLPRPRGLRRLAVVVRRHPRGAGHPRIRRGRSDQHPHRVGRLHRHRAAAARQRRLRDRAVRPGERVRHRPLGLHRSARGELRGGLPGLARLRPGAGQLPRGHCQRDPGRHRQGDRRHRRWRPLRRARRCRRRRRRDRGGPPADGPGRRLSERRRRRREHPHLRGPRPRGRLRLRRR